MKQPSLKAEDGAEFFGRVEPIEGQLRASCYVRTDNRIEGQNFKMCKSEDEVLKWIAQQAGERGFSTWWQLTRK